MNPRHLLLAALLAATATAAPAATSPGTEPARRPNILWITAENYGLDFGCCHYPTVITHGP